MMATISSRERAGGESLHIITSFHLKLPRDVLEDNVKIALLNARTPGVAATHIVLEGDKAELLARIERALAAELLREIERGKLLVSTIVTRPTYFDVLSYSNTLGGGYVAIANSDILFPVETVDRILASKLKPAQGCFALTRWNVTPNGIFIQGMTPSPPWPEREIDDMRRHERNFFSYDAYVFCAPIAVPPDTAAVFIGSLGCDTTLAAIFRASGCVVTNPAIALRIAHFDVKPRSYRSPSAIADLDRNVDALVSALSRPEARVPESVKALFASNHALARGRLWFGHADVGRFGRALQRAIGATAWSDSASYAPLRTRKVKVDRSEIDNRVFDVGPIVSDCEAGRTFIEWEVSGFKKDEHILDVLMNSPYRNQAFPIWQYQWQSLQAPEHMSPGDFQLYEDVMSVFRATLMNGQDSSVHVNPLAEPEATAMAKRMSALLLQDLEDEATSTQKEGEMPPRILMIDPDAINGQGHYLPYDLQLQNAANARSTGVSFLMNRKMDPALVPPGMSVHRLLDSHSWEIANRGIEHPRTDSFVVALEAAIANEKQAHPDRPLLIYMYCGSFEHARLVQEAMGKFDGVAAMIHLFWLSVDAYKSEEYLDTWSHFAKHIASDPRFRLTVATANIQAALRRKTGVFFDVAPHPSTTFGDNADVSRWQSRRLEAGETPVVLFPGGMREEKGFLSSVEAVRSLTTTGEPKFRCVVAARSRADTPRNLVEGLASIRNPLVQVEERALGDGEFIDFLASGDIVVLPYKADAFAERPSGLLIDSITLGRPLIVMEGTWLAEAVRHYGWGEVVADDGGMAIAAAVRKMRARYQQYVDAIRTSREGYIHQHSWGRLLKAIVTGVQAGPRQQPTGLRIVSHERSEHISVDETGVVARLLQARKGRRHMLLDVGAHIGTSAAFFHELGWSIHCFEPDPANREQLVARLGEASNVVIDPRAVSDKPASGVTFYKSPESTGISALHAFRDTHTEANVVDVTTIADYVDAWGITTVDFLKIDVEGFDFSVLKGVPWDRIKPDVIECEYEDAKTVPLGHNWEDIAKFLREHGYAVYVSEWHPIVRYGIAHDWRRVTPYPGRVIPSESWGNILAFRVDPGYEAVKEAFEACLVRRDAPPKSQAMQIPAPPPAESRHVRPDDLRRFKDIYAGKRCFVMGNGPSLNKMDLTKLEGDVVFGCNSIFLLFDRIRWRPTFYTCVDSRVLPDRATEIAEMLRDNPTMQAFFPTQLQDHISKSLTPTRDVLPPLSNIAYFREHWNSKDYLPFSMFSVDINEHVIQPYTVAITMLQIAMYMGFSEIYLIGCDTSYTIPPDVKKEGMTERGEVGLGLTSTQDNDPNHFDPRYFGKDRKWHDPQVDKMIDHYRYAKQVSELRGKTKIFNATVGGNLEVFQRVDFDGLFATKQGERVVQAPGKIGNGRDSYIRPVQTPVRAPGSPAPAALSAPAPPMARPLTLFPIGSTPAQSVDRALGREPIVAVTAPDMTIKQVLHEPVIQPALAPSEAAKASPSGFPQGGAQTARQSSAKSSHGVVRWAVDQIRRRRMAQGLLAVVAGLIVGAGILFAMPQQGDLRPMLLAGAGVSLLGVCGLYFAFQVIRLAQRLRAENAALQQRLLETSSALARLRADTGAESARQSSTLNAIAARLERSLAATTQDVGSRISGLDGAVQEELRKTKEAQKRAEDSLAALGARLAAVDAGMVGAKKAAEAEMNERFGAAELQLQTLSSRITGLDGAAQDDIRRIREAQKRAEDSLAALGARIAAVDTGMAEAKRAAEAESQKASVIAEHLSLLADRAARAEDIAKVAASSIDVTSSALEEHARETRNRLGVAELQLQTLSSFATGGLEDLNQRVSASDARLFDIAEVVRAEAQQASRLAERVAHIDDLAKGAIGSLVTLEDDLRRQAAAARGEFVGLANNLKSVEERAKRELESQLASIDVRFHVADERLYGLSRAMQGAESAGAAEVASLESKIAAVGAKTRQDLTLIGHQLAEVALLSQGLTVEVSTRLKEVDDRAGDAADRIASSEAALSAIREALETATSAGAEEVSALEGRLQAVVSGFAEQRTWVEKRLEVADANSAEALAALAHRLAEVASLSQGFTVEVSTRLKEVDDRAGDAADRLASSEVALSAIKEALEKATSAGAEEVSALERRLQVVASGISEQRSWVENRLEAADTSSAEALAALAHRLAEVALLSQDFAVEVSTRLKEVDDRTGDAADRIASSEAALSAIREALETATSAGAEEVSALEGRLQAIVSDFAEQRTWVEKRFEAADTNSAEARSALEQRLAGVAVSSEAAVAEVRAGLQELGQGVSSLDTRLTQSDTMLAGKADAIELGELADRHAALITLIAESEAAGARAIGDLQDRISSIHGEARDGLSRLQQRIETTLADIPQVKQDIAQLSDLSAQAAIEQLRIDAKLSVSIVDMSSMESKIGAVEKALANALAEAEAAGAREVVKIEQSISAVGASAAGELAKLESRLEALVASKADAPELMDLRQGMAALDARADEVRLESKNLAGKLAEIVERAQVDDAAAYRPFNRKLRPEHMQVLETAWAPKLSLSVTRAGLAYMAGRASEVERELDGRFDASIEDMLLRTLVARATKGASIDVLEIGTLFGAGTAIMFDATKDRFARAHFTLLDPLDDYREDRGIDPVTGLPVSERVVRRNLMRVGVGQDQFRLIKRLSTSADAISEASERLYDVLVIDSDHSYAGVKSDFENYARLVRLGGHIVFGGYGSENSPDVKAFADAELPSARFVTSVGAAWGTAVYRVVQPPQGSPARRRPPPAKTVRTRSPAPNKASPKRKR